MLHSNKWLSFKLALLALCVVIVCSLAFNDWKRHQLLLRLQDPDPQIRHRAFKELNFAVRSKAIRSVKPYLSPVCQVLRGVPSRGSEIEIVGILQNASREDGRHCIGAILERLDEKNDEPSIRRSFAAVLGYLSSTSDNNVVNALSNMLRGDPSESVRREAAIAIGELLGDTNQAVVAALQQGLDDSSPRVTVACAFALWSKTQKREAIDKLIALLDDTEDRVRMDAAGAFSQIGHEIRTEKGECLSTKIVDALAT